MSVDGLAPGLLAGVSLLLAWSAPAGTLRRPGRHGRPPPTPGPVEQTWTRRGRAVGAFGVGLGAALLLGGRIGLVVGVAAAATSWVTLGRLEPPSARRRRERLEQDLPHAVDLLAAALAGGQALEPAVAVVARAVGGPVGEELSLAAVRLRLGVDPVGVWRDLGAHAQLGPLGRSLFRAGEGGAPVSEAMVLLADDLRRETGSRQETRARSVGVKAAIPVGLCLLPAFVLTGVVPLVAGSLSGLLRG